MALDTDSDSEKIRAVYKKVIVDAAISIDCCFDDDFLFILYLWNDIEEHGCSR